MTGFQALGVSGAAGLCILVAAWGYSLVRFTQPVPAQYTAISSRRHRRNGPRKGPLTALIDLVGLRFAPLVLRLMGPVGAARIRTRINDAGRPGGMTVESYAGRKAGYFLVFGTIGVIMVLYDQMLIGIILIAFGWFWADLSLRQLSRQRQVEIEKSLPDFLDILAVTVSAGLGFRQALERVSETVTGPLGEEFQTALRQMELGTPRRRAFEELRERNTCESLGQFITAILQAEELGAPLAQALMEISGDMRREAAQSARRRAARTVPRIQLVISVVMVPGVLILMAGALIMGQGDSVGGLFG